METKIFDYGINGEGVGKIDGKIVLVNNTLVDEVAEIDIVEDHKNYAVGTPRKIIKPSCDRQIPPCPYFYECGGCQLQHMNYSEQLKFKTNHIKKTIKKITGLDREPLFSPIICDYYSGMVMSVQLYTHMLNKVHTVEEVHAMLTEFYKGEKFVQVMPLDAEAGVGNMLSGNACSGWDGLKIFVTGNEDRIVLSSQFDNLGKGASGAAIQCLNIILGCEEDKGLNL